MVLNPQCRTSRIFFQVMLEIHGESESAIGIARNGFPEEIWWAILRWQGSDFHSHGG